MLIMTRRTSETIVVGEKGDVRITVLGVKGNQVRIGVEAPKSTPVHREEVFNRIQAKNHPPSGRRPMRLPAPTTVAHAH